MDTVRTQRKREKRGAPRPSTTSPALTSGSNSATRVKSSESDPRLARGAVRDSGSEQLPRAEHVQIHAGPDAEQAAERLHARAFTVGQHIFFGRGEYKPGTREFDELLDHELVHAEQQPAWSGESLQELPVLPPEHPAERGAERRNRVRGPYLPKPAVQRQVGPAPAPADGRSVVARFISTAEDSRELSQLIAELEERRRHTVGFESPVEVEIRLPFSEGPVVIPESLRTARVRSNELEALLTSARERREQLLSQAGRRFRVPLLVSGTSQRQRPAVELAPAPPAARNTADVGSSLFGLLGEADAALSRWLYRQQALDSVEETMRGIARRAEEATLAATGVAALAARGARNPAFRWVAVGAGTWVTAVRGTQAVTGTDFEGERVSRLRAFRDMLEAAATALGARGGPREPVQPGAGMAERRSRPPETTRQTAQQPATGRQYTAEEREAIRQQRASQEANELLQREISSAEAAGRLRPARPAPGRLDLGSVMADSPYIPTQHSVERRTIERYAAQVSNPGFWTSHPQPILIGPRGEILSGHHRIIAAHMRRVPIPESAIQRAPSAGDRQVTRWENVTAR